MNVIGVDVPKYRSMIEAAGNRSVELGPDACCIKSGAVCAYDERALSALLEEYENLLSKQGWPLDPETFIRKVASEWLSDADPLMPVIRAAFGD